MNKNLYKYTILYRKFWIFYFSKTGIIKADDEFKAQRYIALIYNVPILSVEIRDFEYIEIGD